ncbi:MAG: A/G-specific adenine glycosylase [Deltaproteobacteria bacterium]|nr:A/G-specific adenine glycosylase [Deltaproteobacteria bacterium]
MEISSVRADLLTWYRSTRRDLPWRRLRDPYAVWVSEVMLQQTRVDTVIPYFERFLRRWPTVRALASADPEDVRAAWSGLGYYRRAALMLGAAQRIVAEHDGTLPRDPMALRALPGFGAYTAGAVASIAFDQPVPAVDGNVARVIARLEALEGDVMSGPTHAVIWRLAADLSPGESPGELTQALMELGALLCTPQSPRCDRCPLARRCRALALRRTGEIPPPRRRAKRRTLPITALVARTQAGAVLLEKRPSRGLFAGLWSVPLLDGHLTATDAARAVANRAHVELSGALILGELTHVLTHRELVMQVHSARMTTRRDDDAVRAVPIAELCRLGIPSVTSRTLALSLSEEERALLPGRKRR